MEREKEREKEREREREMEREREIEKEREIKENEKERERVVRVKSEGVCVLCCVVTVSCQHTWSVLSIQMYQSIIVQMYTRQWSVCAMYLISTCHHDATGVMIQLG